MTDKSEWRYRIDLTGNRYGKIVVEGDVRVNGLRWWQCVCDCGSRPVYRTGNLKRGDHTNCGCAKSQVRRDANLKHGHSRRTKEYRAWSHLIGRCECQTDAAFPNYGGRGISVCPEWRESFEAFLSDMGPAPSVRHSVDRIDVNGHYEPSNCRWATPKEQARNTRRTVRLNGRPLRDIADERGLSWSVVNARLRRGATPEQAISSLHGAAYRRAFA